MEAPKWTKEDDAASNDQNAYTVVADILPIPATMPLATDTEEHDTANSLTEEPTLSHSLAMTGNGAEDAIQEPHDGEVLNLGWNERKEKIPTPLVGGLENEDLWLLIRRFNKQMYHVKEVAHMVPGDLDLNVSDEEEFSPDKLRATVERFYMTVVIGLLAVVKHIARLRSWRETKRTSCFCLAYFAAWFYDFIAPLLIAGVITLIVYPRSRGILFPPAPIALVDSRSGGVQKPKAGVLGSHGSATGAPENHRGEAVEREATNFFNGFTTVLVTSATGKNPQETPEHDENSPDNHLPDPAKFVASAAEAKDIASGDSSSSKRDKTKTPIEAAIRSKARPLMHALSDLTDTYERLGNALTPTPPFPQQTHRMRLATTLTAPLLLTSLLTPSHTFVKTSFFVSGLIFFSAPLTSRVLTWLNRRYPTWRRALEMRNTLLKGVPTNAQLTLTLLRVGEGEGAPLPPVPLVCAPALDGSVGVGAMDVGSSLDATREEVEDARTSDPPVALEISSSSDANFDVAKNRTQSPSHKGSKILGATKSVVKGFVKGVIAGDAARAKAGSREARNRLGAVPAAAKDEEPMRVTGPVEFEGRFEGRKGRVYVTTRSTVPAVGFSTVSRGRDGDGKGEKGGEEEGIQPRWSIAVGDIRELRKIGGYGWKAKLVVGWSLGREVHDGLEITDRRGEVRRITAVPLRDELFNRLVAMGGQKWESW